MRLLRLDVTNWCSHPEISVDLSRGLQIEGRNGTGKSSLLEAIRYVFRETARGYTNRIRNGERSATVRLSFEAGGVGYVIEKTLHLERPTSAIMLADGIQVADNPSSVYKRLQAILPEEVFDKLLYIPQGGLTTVLERLSGKDGKLEMDRLFGLDRLERVWEKAGVEVQEAEARLGVVDGELGKHPENAQESFKAAIEAHGRGVASLEARLKAASEEISSVKSGLAESHRRLGKLADARKALEALSAEKNWLRVDEARTANEAENVTARLSRLAERGLELERLRADAAGLAKYGPIRSYLQELGAVDERIRQASGLEAKRVRLSVLERAVSDKQRLEGEHAKASSDLLAEESAQAASQARLKDAVDHLRHLTALDGKAKCPTCGQHLNAFNMEREARETEERMKALEASIGAFGPSIRDRRRSLKALDENIGMLKAAEVEITHVSREIGEGAALAAKLAEERRKHAEKLENAGYKGESPESVEAAYSELNRLAGRMQSLSDELSAAGALAAREAELKSKAAAIRAKSAALDAKIGALSYDEKEAKALSDSRDMLSDRAYRLDSEIRTASSDLTRALRDKAEAETMLGEYNVLKTRQTDARKGLELLKAARDVYHRDRGLVRYLREDFIRRLNGLLTFHFKRFNQNPRYVDVSFDKDYRLVFRTTAGTLEAGRISGGEMAQLALALRIALIDLMSPLPLLILDEPFGSLDEPHRELLGESLNKLSEQGQLLLVTHVHVESLQLPNTLDLGGY
jgi:DNA repair exonuclease SbcCD ATPase subunit